MNTCRVCNEPVDLNYCPNCGQSAKLKRIDHRYVIQELGDFFFANKGMIYTIKNVFIRPGKSVKQFITEDRYRFVKPITFLFLTTLVYALVAHLFNISLEDVSPIKVDTGEDAPVSYFANWIMGNPRYTVTMIVLFVALWVKIFFRKAGYNYFEIFILMCFISGITTLIDTVGVMIQGLTHLKSSYISIIGIIFHIWAIGQFFDQKKVSGYIKAFLSYTLGALTLGILVLVVVLIEFAVK